MDEQTVWPSATAAHDEMSKLAARRIGIPPDERIVVDRADPIVLVSAGLVDAWRSGQIPGVQVDADGHVVTFGTAGEGCGVVVYQIDNETLSGQSGEALVRLTRVDGGDG